MDLSYHKLFFIVSFDEFLCCKDVSEQLIKCHNFSAVRYTCFLKVKVLSSEEAEHPMDEVHKEFEQEDKME